MVRHLVDFKPHCITCIFFSQSCIISQHWSIHYHYYYYLLALWTELTVALCFILLLMTFSFSWKIFGRRGLSDTKKEKKISRCQYYIVQCFKMLLSFVFEMLSTQLVLGPPWQTKIWWFYFWTWLGLTSAVGSGCFSCIFSGLPGSMAHSLTYSHTRKKGKMTGRHTGVADALWCTHINTQTPQQYTVALGFFFFIVLFWLDLKIQ